MQLDVLQLLSEHIKRARMPIGCFFLGNILFVLNTVYKRYIFHFESNVIYQKKWNDKSSQIR